jgi:hypothetical protein
MTESNHKWIYITRDSLLRDITYGTHVLDKPIAYGTHMLDKPIDGYKKVDCVVEYKKIGLAESIKPERQIKQCIASLKIPKGATVIRPCSKIDYTSSKLRTNTYEVLDIVPNFYYDNVIGEKVVEASSIYSPTYKYEKGKTYKEVLDPREYEQCTSGLHFFLDEVDANRYIG